VAREALILDEAVANGSSDFKPLPAAWYDVEIDEVEEKESTSTKNPGKPMYKYKLKVVGGDHDGRILFVTACLWQEAIYTQVDIQKALGIEPEDLGNGKKKFVIADEDDLVGKELKVRVIQKDKYVKPGEQPEKNEDGSLVQDNEVKSFKARGAATPGTKAKAKAGAKQSDGSFAL
jgi:hypothetical protein